jgi:hypothetical protein
MFLANEPACRGGERRRKNLIRLGVRQGLAYAWSRTRKGGWAIAQSPVLITTITLERLRKRGYEMRNEFDMTAKKINNPCQSMLAHYQIISPQLNEPLYTRTVQPVPFFSGYSGVRGALRLGHQTEPSTRLCPVLLSFMSVRNN